MGDNRRVLAKQFNSKVILSRGPFKPRYWSLDPTDRGLTGLHCITPYLMQHWAKQKWIKHCVWSCWTFWSGCLIYAQKALQLQQKTQFTERLLAEHRKSLLWTSWISWHSAFIACWTSLYQRASFKWIKHCVHPHSIQDFILQMRTVLAPRNILNQI